MKNIPNIISLFRIALIPLFIWQVLAGNLLAAAVILVVSGLTDFLDGFLARRFNWVTPLGKVLDPVADKLTQVTVCVMLLIELRQWWYFFAFILFKEAVMLTLGGYLLKKGIKLEGARWFGKVATFLFYIVMIVLLVFPGIPNWLSFTMLAVTAGCALIAALLYIPEFLKYRASIKAKKEAKGS